MPATHFSGRNSRTGLDPFALKTTPPPPPCMHIDTHWTGFLHGVPKTEKGMPQLGDLGEEKGTGVLLSDMLPVDLAE